MTKLKKRLQKIGIKSSIIIAFIILVFVPFLVFSGISFLAFQRYVIHNQSKAAADTLHVVGVQLADTLKDCEQQSMRLYYGDYIEWMDPAHEMTGAEKQQIQNMLDSIAQTEPAVCTVVLKLSDGSIMFSGFYLSQKLDAYSKTVLAGNGKCFWFGPGSTRHSSLRTYVLGRALNSRTHKKVAEIYYYFYEDAITDVFEQLDGSYQCNFLTDQDGTVFYASDASFLPDFSNFTLPFPKEGTEPESETIFLDGKRYLYVTRKLPSYDWYCVSLITLDDLIWDIGKMMMPFLLIVVLYILFLSVMIRFLQKYIFRPLTVLEENMDRYAVTSRQTVEMEEIGTGEFRNLSRHFNNMIRRNNSLMEQYKKETKEKNHLQMTMMASQLTPHFIYNSLNTLKWLAVLNHQEKIRMVTESLIYIFMSAARTEDESYTLADELKLVENYAIIQQVRFMNFDLNIQSCPEAEDCHIRKLLLQPIVENAIVHGLQRGRAKKTEIVIHIWIDENLHIQVQDFGVGFDVDEWRTFGRARRSHTNIGIDHVEQLIRMEYGPPYCLEIESGPGMGTTVRYLLPAIHSPKAE